MIIFIAKKKALEMRLTDLEKYLALDIQEKCEDQDEISVFKSEDVVVDPLQCNSSKFRETTYDHKV
ncbi:hypothetical protein HAX54_051474, partial [Datura stramonium]|nr:hypothetical protein [Datura stramonium]